VNPIWRMENNMDIIYFRSINIIWIIFQTLSRIEIYQYRPMELAPLGDINKLQFWRGFEMFFWKIGIMYFRSINPARSATAAEFTLMSDTVIIREQKRCLITRRSPARISMLAVSDLFKKRIRRDFWNSAPWVWEQKLKIKIQSRGTICSMGNDNSPE